ncbi:MAG: cytochrome P450 [Alphaproteobacteria bacterium]|nr:cytochrome P450 [Alphaproteobacteria bacterium]
MATKNALHPIPNPPGKPIVGNALTVDPERPLQGLMDLTREHGPIFWLDMMGKPMVIVSGAKLVNELCDEKRFDKAVRGALKRVRVIADDGLFTADTQAPNWSKAHNILLPTFAQRAMVDYLPMMADIAGQLVLKWERMNADDDVDVVHDMTGLALDTIGLCGFDYRFNSFYREDFHPFIDALTRTLETCMLQRGLPFENMALRGRLDQLKKDAGYMNALVDKIIRERKREMAQGGEAANDLLNYMLRGVDKATGESLSDENIRYQINTFLIAGHETTSGLLSFTLYFLLKHPDVLARAQAEADEVLGTDLAALPTFAQIMKLDYIRAVLMESLRLWPTAPAFSVYPYKDETIGDGYSLKRNTFTTVLTLMLHRDPDVWGDDPETFNPDNFSREAEAARPAYAYKPFGNGQRACIGRQFAIQEAVLVLGMILQRFDLVDPYNYELKVKETMSIKPDGFRMRVRLREGRARSALAPARAAAREEAAAGESKEAPRAPKHGTPLTVLFGSNLGATEGFARELVNAGDLNGFETTIASLDDFVGKLPTDGAVVIASASYNGTPPDNAGKFVDWLGGLGPDALKGVSYAVFGCGNRDWAATYQAVPRLIDERMAAAGATRLKERGEADARDDQEGQFLAWSETLWPTVSDAFGLNLVVADADDAEPLYRIEIAESVTANPVANQTGAIPMKVVANYELHGGGSHRSTRHVEVELPEGVAYKPGDHLCVVPVNRPAVAERLIRRYGFDNDSFIRIHATGGRRSPFPNDSTFSVRRLADLFGEIQAVASRKDVAVLARYTRCPDTKRTLESLSAPAVDGGEDLYRKEIFLKRKSVFNLLEEFPACELPFEVYLELIPWMSPRYYSISSSPLADAGRVSVTVGVVASDARSGLGRYEGVCSNYLAETRIGDTIYAVVKDASGGFAMPNDPATPLIMVGPGTGLAPFRGFIRHRRALKAQGAILGPALLFFGCRHPELDYLYREELLEAEKEGLVELYAAFSRFDGRRVYVQDLIREKRDRVWDLIEKDARIYVCGDGAAMEPDVKRALTTLYAEEKDVALEDAEAWMERLAAQGGYALDVWAGN